MSATVHLYRDDPYAAACAARVVAITPEGGVVVDRTVFYPQGGGQPGDQGLLRLDDGREIPIRNAVYGPDRSQIVHQIEGEAPPLGAGVSLSLDWPLRYKRMRVHTALHLLSVVLPYPVTGGAIGDGEGRLDFDIPDAGLDRAEIADKLNALVARDSAVRERWITDEELDTNPGLVKTMSVKPPRGTGRVRLVEIDGIDLQPCGGTHVKRTGEIGPVQVTKIENKGKQNRRINIAFVEGA